MTIKLDNYELAHKTYDLVKAKPYITRVDLNKELKTTFDTKKNQNLSLVLRSMLVNKHVCKRFYREDNRVEFWIYEGALDKGDAILVGDKVVDYYGRKPRLEEQLALRYSIKELLDSKEYLYSFGMLRAKFTECTDSMLQYCLDNLVSAGSVKQVSISTTTTVMYCSQLWVHSINSKLGLAKDETELPKVEPVVDSTSGKFYRYGKGLYKLQRDNTRRKDAELTQNEYDAIVAFYEKSKSGPITQVQFETHLE